jgi:hypothetical protein
MQIGEAFLLLLFCGLFAPYLAIGILWQKYKRDESGLDLIPNREFWRGLPELVKDGCRFSFNKAGGFKVQWAANARYEVL